MSADKYPRIPVFSHQMEAIVYIVNRVFLLMQQCSKLKKNPGCPYFKSRATKAVNLGALMNPWLPSR